MLSNLTSLMNHMQIASTCKVRFKLTSSMNACLLPIQFHAMNNMRLVPTCEVKSKLTWSLGSMLTFNLFNSWMHAHSHFGFMQWVPTCSYLWMHVYSHFDYMQFTFNSFHEQHAYLRLASTCKVEFKFTWSFEGTLTLNLVTPMNDKRFATISLFHFELRLIMWCMLTFV